jgi:hypothetical protein
MCYALLQSLPVVVKPEQIKKLIVGSVLDECSAFPACHRRVAQPRDASERGPRQTARLPERNNLCRGQHTQVATDSHVLDILGFRVQK